MEFADQVRVFLFPAPLIKQKEDHSVTGIIGNPEGYISQMQKNALLRTQQDVITIPLDEYKKYNYKLGDIVEVEIKLWK